ncbi:MAG: FtsX-like permease family protein [Synechococcales cyanobacterium RM1_1_8]|nr:FtsX-like permease family protein [Synechococcales cyanobacterium RM1_1_8]
MIGAIPLAWLQLMREKARLAVALAGIGFAVILMFIQLGFRDALFDSSVRLHEALQGDIFMVSPQSTALIALDSFSRRRLLQAEGVPGVASTISLYINFALWKNPVDRSTRSIFVLGYDPSEPIFEAALLPDAEPLKLPDYVLFDRDSRPEFGPVAELIEAGKTVTTELGGRRITVGGLFQLGASFGADGNLITSDLNFLRLFDSEPGLIHMGMVRLAPTADLDQVLATMRREIQEPSGDVLILSKAEFIELERSYWQNSTAIGFIFNLGAGIGWIVGMVIVYQILYTDVADHLAEYATLKAMGYRNRYLLSVVFQEAVVLSVLGFIPAFFLCLGLYAMTENATSLPIQMTLARGQLVFTLTIVMCVISGAIAVRKVQEADPADIF